MKIRILIFLIILATLFVNAKGIVKVATIDQLTVELSRQYDLAVVMEPENFGTFVYDEHDKKKNNGGTIINGWKRIFNGIPQLAWFGGKAKGEKFDNTPILQKVYAAGYKNVFIGSGTWHFGKGEALKKVNVYTGGNIDARLTQSSKDIIIVDSRNNRGVMSSIRNASGKYRNLPREELLIYVGTDKRGVFRRDHSSAIQMYTAQDPKHNGGIFFSIPSKIASSTNFAVISPTHPSSKNNFNKDNYVLISRNSAYTYSENQRMHGLLTLENAGAASGKPAIYFDGGTADIGYKKSFMFDISAIDDKTGKKRIMFYMYSPENYVTLGEGVELGRDKKRIKKAYFESLKVTAHHGSTSINFKDIPTSDPHIIGEIYRQGSDLKISMGK